MFKQTILEEIQSGKTKLIVSLMAFKREKEQTVCNTLEEAKALLGKKMAVGWHYALLGNQFGEHAYGAQHDEVLKALGIKTLAELEDEYQAEEDRRYDNFPDE